MSLTLSPDTAAQIRGQIVDSLHAKCTPGIRRQLIFLTAAWSALVLAYLVALSLRVYRSRPRLAGLTCFRVLRRSSGLYAIPLGMVTWTR